VLLYNGGPDARIILRYDEGLAHRCGGVAGMYVDRALRMKVLIVFLLHASPSCIILRYNQGLAHSCGVVYIIRATGRVCVVLLLAARYCAAHLHLSCC
jgi:hypothetical protein